MQNFSCQNSESYWRYQKCLSWKLKHLNSHLNLNPFTHEGFKKRRRERQRERETERDRERQRQRQRDRERDRETETEREEYNLR